MGRRKKKGVREAGSLLVSNFFFFSNYLGCWRKVVQSSTKSFLSFFVLGGNERVIAQQRSSSLLIMSASFISLFGCWVLAFFFFWHKVHYEKFGKTFYLYTWWDVHNNYVFLYTLVFLLLYIYKVISKTNSLRWSEVSKKRKRKEKVSQCVCGWMV